MVALRKLRLNKDEGSEIVDVKEHSNTHMDPELYKYAENGNAAKFMKTLSELTGEDKHAQDQFLLLQVSPQKNTFLHIAACFGHKDLAEKLLELCPTLLKMKNAEDDTALHVAARAGNLYMVVSFLKSEATDIEHGDELLRTMRNKEGNTALHEALINHHKSVSNCLIKAVLPVSYYYINNEGKSALYLAAEAGYVKLVKLILEEKAVENGQGLQGKSPVYAAILGRNKDVLETILNRKPTIKGEDGRNLFYLAVSKGYLQGVRLLLGDCRDGNLSQSDRYPARPKCLSDSYVTFLIHIASSKGYVDIMKELLQSCPDSIELLNKDDQNILHLAANSGRDSVVSYVLKKYRLQKLINQKDKHGNTPLHLATLHSHPNVVSTLTWDKRINLNLINDDGLTAFDIAWDNVSAFRGSLTWTALKSAGAQRAHALKLDRKDKGPLQQRNQHDDTLHDTEIYKDRVNTLALVATLIVTVTFAAGFTIPGGFNNSNPNQGMATFLTKYMFHIFVICNAMAMYSSIFVAVILIWAQLGDANLAITSLHVAVPLLGLALTMMSLAFMAGIYVVVSGLAWLAIVVLVMGIICTVIIVALFILFFPTTTSSSCIARYITYYPFRLVAFATQSHG